MIIRSIKKSLIIMLIVILYVNSICSVKVSADSVEVLTSEDIIVEGFQIKTIETEDEIAFRTISKAPSIGSMMVVSGKNYIVKALGIIYSKDPNVSGVNSQNILDKSYTELNSTPYHTSSSTGRYKYIGTKEYNNKNYTFGYIATEKAVQKKENGKTTYIFTMRNVDNIVMNTMRIRGFVEAIDQNGKEVIIYGKYAAVMSVAEVSHRIYVGSMANDEKAHKYIYNNILNKLSPLNKYYRDVEEEYGWGGSVEI